MENTVTMPAAATKPSHILIVGASRGLGCGMAAEFLARGWTVTGTVRGEGRTELHELAERHGDRLAIETVDIDAPDQVAALAVRLEGQALDVLFVNAGTNTRGDDNRAGDVAADEFARVLAINALGPVRVIEALQHRVAADGIVGVMSSGQGSITNNEKGGHEVYRSSKAALNMLMRSYAARDGFGRPIVLLAPGWTRTGLGGADAPQTVGEVMPGLVEVLLDQRGRPGLRFLDRWGRPVPW